MKAEPVSGQQANESMGERRYLYQQLLCRLIGILVSLIRLHFWRRYGDKAYMDPTAHARKIANTCCDALLTGGWTGQEEGSLDVRVCLPPPMTASTTDNVAADIERTGWLEALEAR